MSGLRKLASQTALYGLSSILGRVLNVLLTPMYAHYFRPQEFGIFSDLYAQLIFPLTFLTFGLETTFFRFADRDLPARDAYAQSFLTVFYLTLLAAVTVGFNIQLIADWAGYPNRSALYGMLVIITALDAVAALPMARLRYQEKVLWFAIISLTNIGLTIVLNIVFVAVLGWGVEWVFVANIIASAVKLGMALYGNVPHTWALQPGKVRALTRYGFYIMLIGLSGQVNEQLDKVMLPRLWPAGKLWNGTPRSGLELNAIYNVSYKLGMALSLATQAFRYAAEPFFFKQATDKNAPELTAKVFHYFVLTALSVSLLVSVFAPEILSFQFFGLRDKPLFNPLYWEGARVVPLILLANTFLGAYITLSMWFKLTGQLRFGLLFSLVGSLVTVLVNALFIPLWGYLACGIAHLACYGIMVTLCYGVGQHYKPYPYRLRPLVIALAAVGFAFLVIQIAANQIPGEARLFGFKFLICTVTLGALWWLLTFKPQVAATAAADLRKPAGNNRQNKPKPPAQDSSHT
jgi:O-antigen/teichoic acid export membrane protein